MTQADSEHVRKLVAEAAQAAAAGNLIIPPGDSAYDKYRAALAIDGNSKEALDGIARLPARAKELFDKALGGRHAATRARVARHGAPDRAVRSVDRADDARSSPASSSIRPKRACAKAAATMPRVRSMRRATEPRQSAPRAARCAHSRVAECAAGCGAGHDRARELSCRRDAERVHPRLRPTPDLTSITMCLLLIAVRAVPGKPLLLLGNRDEFRARASAAAQPGSEDARIVGGRDLVAGGSWLALRADGRFAAVTNVRTGLPATAPRSRGWLVRDFMLGDATPRDFLDARARGRRELRRVQSRRRRSRRHVGATAPPIGAAALEAGRPRDQQRPHRRALAEDRALATALRRSDRVRSGDDDARLLDLLTDERQPADAACPIPASVIELERLLAPVFVRGARTTARARARLRMFKTRARVLCASGCSVPTFALKPNRLGVAQHPRQQWLRD